MEQDVLNGYEGFIVLIKPDEQRHRHMNYVWKLTRYDEDFVELNPVTYCDEQVDGEKAAIERVRKFIAKEKGSPIVLGRGIIATLEILAKG